MIEASFEGMAERSAAVSGAYQYDTGQRLKMHGLPSPAELAGRDDFLSGDVVTVQAQYAFRGDSQTETRLAVYDEETGTWTAAVPDSYLTRCEDVQVYIYVGYGQTEESMRAKTCYEAVFRPVSRPAPGTEVTPDQKNAWDALAQEVNLAIADMGRAASNANAQAAVAKEAAEWAQSSAQKTDDGMAKINATTVTAQSLPPGSEATVVVTEKGTHKEVAFGIPKGMPGVIMINGKEVTDGGTIDLTPEDIGARPAELKTALQFEAEIVPNGWIKNENISVYDAVIRGILASDTPVADVVTSGIIPLTRENIEKAVTAWEKVFRIMVDDGRIRLICFSDDQPMDSFKVKLLCVR